MSDSPSIHLMLKFRAAYLSGGHHGDIKCQDFYVIFQSS